MNQQEQRIREFAYEIWQSEGCPEGQDARHWEMARKLFETQNSAPTAKPAERARKAATKPTDATPTGKPAKDAGNPQDVKPAKAAGNPQDVKPAKAAAASKGSARPRSKAATEAQAGTPETIKKPRAPRSTKTSS